MYKVSKYGHTREHIVKVTEADHISCTCMKFESMGILCCHTIRILDVIRGVDKISDEYILKRWTKTAKVVNIKEIDGQDIEIKDSKLIVVNRYRILCPIFVRMIAKASETDEGYKLAATCVNELSARLKQIMEVTAPSLHTTGSTRDLPEENNDRNLLSRAKKNIVSGDSNSDKVIGAPVPKNVPIIEEGVGPAEDESFLMVDKVVPCPGKARTDFNSPAGDEPKPVFSMMDVAGLMAFKAK
uniref:Protein FAR1-RELATED SEQUENCE n=1 Tax=Nicotiana sylvestris TaxID=4096 RepID=A0A1U7W3W3_NICSY|nr:PREDICTED: protein FAR1-RELATED SEQUENCE 1-like [Nicotiana sylvestris]